METFGLHSVRQLARRVPVLGTAELSVAFAFGGSLFVLRTVAGFLFALYLALAKSLV
jgi:hypothetical protein